MIIKNKQGNDILKGGEKKLLEKIKKNNKNIALLDELVEKYWLEEKME